jgi:hypothetical protein
VLREKAGHDSALGLIAKRLRGETEDIMQEPLPERWVDLIHYLDERERKLSEAARSEEGDRHNCASC